MRTYLDAVQKGKKFVHKYTDLLQRFGYQDIYVKIPHYTSFNRTPPALEITHINMFFWYGRYGYSLKISGDSSDIDTDVFFSDCDIIVEFLSNPLTLKEINIEEAFLQHLEFRAFNISFINSTLSNKDCARIVAYKGNVKYHFYLWRQDANIEAQTSLEENSDSFDPTDEDTHDLADLNDYFDDFLQNDLKKSGWEVNVHPSFQKVLITKSYSNGLTLYREIISYRSTLLESEVKEDFRFIIFCIMDETPAYHELEDSHFHIHKNSRERNSFFAYNEGERYEIKFGTERFLHHSTIMESSATKNKIIKFDHMDGHEFEFFCAKVLSLNDFEDVHITQGSRDQGIDIITIKDGIKYGIQCKCYSSPIGNKAVQEVFAGKSFYQCHVGVVLTNNYFTSSAIELAQRNGIALWDRSKLQQLVDNCQHKL